MASEYNDPPVYGVDSPDDDDTSSSNPDATLAIIPIHDPKPDPPRVLFQRLWTDDDEIELLRGFSEYTAVHGGDNTAPFYDQIKSKLQIEFNKSQLVEKLRRLKKKYRNIVAKIEAGKEYVFKTHHEKACFEISKTIWYRKDSEINNFGCGSNDRIKGFLKNNKRPRPEENLPQFNQNPQFNQQSTQFNQQNQLNSAKLVPGLIEETLKSCLTPILKELVNCAATSSNSVVGFGFGNSSPMGCLFGMGNLMEDKWRKQNLLELEVYSKRLELVQDDIKSRIEDLTKGL